ncbi:MAG: AI-2E family transporter [Planctomycetes bacterium]|nr:AI-2E family transporter [Planctomycetota bacterium]
MTIDQPARRFFFLLLAGATVLVAWTARPLATPLFLATVLAVVLWPVHEWLTAKLRKRPSLSAAALAFGTALLLVAPIAALSAFVVKEGSAGIEFASTFAHSDGLTQLVAKLPAPLEKLANDVLAHVPEEHDDASSTPTKDAKAGKDEGADERATTAGGQAVAAVGNAAKATGSLLFGAAMMLIALYFLLLHGEALVAWLDGLLPLARGQTRELLTEFKSVSYAVVVSTVVTSAVQAAAALVGYLIAQVPHPIFFTGVTFFVAFIPAVGAASVCFVAALVLFATGHPYMAVFLVAWGLLVVGLVDNLVKPLLMKSGMHMSGAIVFFALIGGLSAFGSAGLLIGPLVVALFLALLRIYQRDFKKTTRA